MAEDTTFKPARELGRVHTGSRNRTRRRPRRTPATQRFVSRDEFLPFALPDIDDAEFTQVSEVLNSGWLTTGPKTRAFEEEFKRRVGAEYAIAVNSCTAAMHLALEAVGVRRGDEVITTPYTFAATAEVIRYFDARPVFVDVLPHDFTLNVALLEDAITERTRAIIPVHVAGQPAELDEIYRIAEKYGIAVIEDAAHAFPSSYKGYPIGSAPGNHRSIVCFSFYATKTITTAEGGMICTNDAEIAERCRIMSLHGISRDAWKRYAADGNWYYEIVAPGYKYNMTDLAAAIGLAQLRKAERMWERRREVARQYSQAFAAVPELQVPDERQDCQHAWHLYMLRLRPEELKIDRAQFVRELKQRNVGTSVHFIPLHIHPYYLETYGYEPDDLPIAHREYLREISLPIYSRMSEDDVEYVIEAVLNVVEKGAVRAFPTPDLYLPQ